LGTRIDFDKLAWAMSLDSGAAVTRPWCKHIFRANLARMVELSLRAQHFLGARAAAAVGARAALCDHAAAVEQQLRVCSIAIAHGLSRLQEDVFAIANWELSRRQLSRRRPPAGWGQLEVSNSELHVGFTDVNNGAVLECRSMKLHESGFHEVAMICRIDGLTSFHRSLTHYLRGARSWPAALAGPVALGGDRCQLLWPIGANPLWPGPFITVGSYGMVTWERTADGEGGRYVAKHRPSADGRLLQERRPGMVASGSRVRCRSFTPNVCGRWMCSDPLDCGLSARHPVDCLRPADRLPSVGRLAKATCHGTLVGQYHEACFDEHVTCQRMAVIAIELRERSGRWPKHAELDYCASLPAPAGTMPLFSNRRSSGNRLPAEAPPAAGEHAEPTSPRDIDAEVARKRRRK